MEPLHGVLDLLVLRTLRFGPLHGYAIVGAIRANSGDALNIEFGSPHPPRRAGDVRQARTPRWETSEHNRRAKVYRLTATGKKQLQQEASEWSDFVKAVARVLNPRPGQVDS